MAHPAERTTPARLSRAVLVGGTVGSALVLAPVASAVVDVPPGTFVVDEAGVLSSAEEQQLSQEITRLRTQAGQNLYVVYVDEHPDGIRGIVQDVANSRGLSANDNVLAIEVEQRRYGLNTNERLDPAEDVIDGSYVNPLFQQVGTTDDWLAPAVAAVEGLDDAADGRMDGRGRTGETYDPAGALPGAAGTDQAPGDGAGGALTGALGAAALAAE